MRKAWKALVLTLVVALVSAPFLGAQHAAAQGPSGAPMPPSLSGGIPGSPGMAGMATVPQPPVGAPPAPAVPQPNPPSFQAPSVPPPSFNPQALGELPSGLAAQLQGGMMGALQGSGNRPPLGQGQGQGALGQLGAGGQGAEQPWLSGLAAWGSGYAPFSQGPDGQWSRFGARGTANIPLATLPAFSSALEWLQQGGFGAPTAPPTGFDPTQLPPMSESWQPPALPEEMPSAPAPYGDLSALFEAQAALQEAQAQAANQQGPMSEEMIAALDQATAQAQAAYDQFWADYYEAVDATAQAYYEAVVASAEYLAETYGWAVEYALAAADYYYTYYDYYAMYCYFYPWDCYMYAYDVVSGAYYYVGETSDAPTGTVEIGEVAVETYPTTAAPAPSADAYEAVTLFGNAQLGAPIEPLYAGGLTEEILAQFQLLPPKIQGFAVQALLVSNADYWALVNGGMAAVMTSETPTPETLAAALSSNASGVYMVRVQAEVPQDAAGALDMITHVYPALEGLAFAQVSDIQGQAFTATAAGLGIEPNGGGAVSAPKVIYVGVVESEGVPIVYALVGVGEDYVNVIASGQ